jgi:hypothetical protein
MPPQLTHKVIIVLNT